MSSVESSIVCSGVRIEASAGAAADSDPFMPVTRANKLPTPLARRARAPFFVSADVVSAARGASTDGSSRGAVGAVAALARRFLVGAAFAVGLALAFAFAFARAGFFGAFALAFPLGVARRALAFAVAFFTAMGPRLSRFGSGSSRPEERYPLGYNVEAMRMSWNQPLQPGFEELVLETLATHGEEATL